MNAEDSPSPLVGERRGASPSPLAGERRGASPSPLAGEGRGGGSWQLPALIAIAVAGTVISIYLTITHISPVPLLCTVGGPINCVSVTHSPWSVIPGTSIPISVLGILWFVVAAVLAVLSYRPESRASTRAAWTLFLWAALGLAEVLYLVYIEVVRLHQICEWCTVVHIFVLLTFILAMRRVQTLAPTTGGS